MGNPQIEDGYTKIANELLEQLAKSKLNGTKRRIIDVIIRYTYGFNRKSHNLSLTFISAATDIDKGQVKRELNSLIECNIIKVFQEASFNKTRVIGLNKNYLGWVLNSTQVTKENTGEQIAHSQGANSHTPQGANSHPKKESIKENKKESNFRSVFDYYMELNLVKHRTYTKDMERAITKAVKDNKYDIEYCKTLLSRHEEVVRMTKEKKHSVKPRGITEFFGQKAYQTSHLICSEYDIGGKFYEQYFKVKPKNKHNDEWLN